MAILTDYEWTGKLQPFAHQKETAAFLAVRKKAFCFNEQGTGKTASVIWAADYLMKQGRIKRVLVLCPLSIMKAAWQQDLFKFAMHRSCSIAHGDAAQRKKILAAGADFVILNFDGLAVIKDEVMAGGFDLIVVDECFVAGTLVQTPQGPRPIETLSADEMVFTSSGSMPIRTVRRRESTDIVEVKLSNGERITCTGDHPFFTDVGWVVARNLGGRRLVSRADVSSMRAPVSGTEGPVGLASEVGDQQVSMLLKILRTEEVAPAKSGEILFCGYATGTAGYVSWSGAQRGVLPTYGSYAQSFGTPPSSSPGKWHGDDSNGGVSTPSAPPSVGMELPRSVGETAARLSYELQAGLCVPGEKTGVGSGRSQSSDALSEATGPEKRSQTNGAWVESVSHIKCGSGVYVYNIEVAGTPNYFVGDGWLAHNCTAYKNPSTNRWKVLRDVVATAKGLWMLTGTPAAQSPVDAYGLAKLVNPEGTPKFFGQYRDSVMYKVTQFKWVPKMHSQETVHKVLQPAIRFERAQCLDLPDVTHVDRDAPLTAQQKKYYAKLKYDMLIEAAGEEVSAVNAAAKINKLLQISGGAVYTDTGEVIEFDVSNRLNVVMEVIEEASNKVLVFVPFTHTIELLRAHLEKHKISCAVINGKVPVNKRSDIVQDFQNRKDPHVLIIQPQAASHGLTLTAANTIIWYAPVTSVETYLQANARINRPGQKNAMQIVHIRGSDVEEKLYTMLQGNIENHERIIDLYRHEVQN